MCLICMSMGSLYIPLNHTVAAAQGPQDPQDPFAAAPQPAAQPPARLFPTGLPAQAYGPGQGPYKITKVNKTNDPRVLWEDGNVAVIYAKDFPAGVGIGRTRTRSNLQDVLAAQIDDQLQTAPGKGSSFDFVKVWLKDLLAHPLPGPTQAKVVGRLPIDPKQFVPTVPTVAKSGRYKGAVIPDFPHDCAACGGKCYQGMFSCVHDTPDGKCPAEKPKEKKGRR